MIDIDGEDGLFFPNNVVLAIAEMFGALDSRFDVYMRPLSPRDPNLAIGIFANTLVDVEESREVGRTGATLQQYTFTAQSLVKDPDKIRALRSNSIVSTILRTTLDSSPSMVLALAGLTATLGSITSTVKKWKITNTRYLNNAIEGNNVYLAVIDLMVEVETK